MNILIHVPPIKISSLTETMSTVYPSSAVTVLLNLRGQTRVTVNNIPHTLLTNDIIVLNYRDVCSILRSNSLLLVLSVETSLLNLNSKNKSLYFECDSTKFKNKSPFNNLRASIIKAVKSHNDMTSAKAFSIAYEIIDELTKNFSSSASPTKIRNPIISEIIDYIEKNYSENLLFNDIAQRFNMSVPYLSKLFKECVGTTFANFYDELRINHSLYDLKETNETIIDIAFKHGFSNNHAYIRAFKKVLGTLPNDMRKQYKSNNFQQEINEEELKEIINLLGVNQPAPSNNEGTYIYTNYLEKNKVVLEKNPASEVLGIGSAATVLHKDIQKIIKNIQSTFPFRYAYIRGIFSDALSFCTRDYDGRLRFKYAMIDEVLDFLLAAKLIPLLSFTYMPKVLTRDESLIYQDGYYICEPKRLEEWGQLISNFLHHIITRYGLNEIKKWIFLPWVQLDSQNKHLGFNDELSFFLFYKTSYDAVKEISKDLIVSSPEIYPSYDMEYLSNYLLWAKCNNCFPDLLAVKFFPNTNWKVIEIKNNNTAYRKTIDNEISSDESLMKKSLLKLKNFLSDNGYNLDVYITAFNYTITDSHPILDTRFSAAYYIKNYIDTIDIVKSLCYWKLSDDNDEEQNMPLFTGSAGMYLKNGIPKGTAQAIRYLSYIQPYITDSGENFILSTNKENSDYYRLLLYNYEHPSAAINDDIYSENFNPYSLFTKKRKTAIHFKLNNVPFKNATIKMFIMNSEHGSPYDKWISMGKPFIDYYSNSESVLFDILNSATCPDFKMFNVPTVNGILSLDFELELFDIITVEIILEN